MSCCLASASIPNELTTPHRELHIEDLGNRIMVPKIHRKQIKLGLNLCFLTVYLIPCPCATQNRGKKNNIAINSASLHHFQFKGPQLHQGQLLHNGLLASYLSNVLLLNLSSWMQNKAQGHISCSLSSCPEHRLSALSLGLDKVGLNCHQADLKVCVRDTPPHRVSRRRAENVCPSGEKERKIVGKLISEETKDFNIPLPCLL